jgi:hypothetical protein
MNVKDLADSGPASANRLPPSLGHGSRRVARRLFATCWLIYSLHLATNTVREIYPALSIGDSLSFRVDEYAGLHPDLFEKPGFGWHINSNPGASIVAAIPYAVAGPVVRRIVERVNASRRGSEPPEYVSPWPMARQFYAEAWRRGLDVKFGLASIITQTFVMAPLSAAGVASMFLLLRILFDSNRAALCLALLYGFGTPVFFRTGYLNHNLMVGHAAFWGFLLLWNPGRAIAWTDRSRYLVAGLCGGAAVLLDYSGVVFLAGLLIYGLAKARTRSPGTGLLSKAIYYAIGAAGPIALLWAYQWQAFGHPFYPAQHWMPPARGSDVGYQGFGWPDWGTLMALLWDYRYGLFTSCPLFLLALLAPFAGRVRPGTRDDATGPSCVLPPLEMIAVFAFSAGLWLFCGGIGYTLVQFNTGIRYLAPLFPFLFLLVAICIKRLPLSIAYGISVLAFAQAWAMAMYRDVERGLGVLEPMLHVFIGGFQLPALSVLERMGGPYGEYARGGGSPLPLFLAAAALIYGIWALPGPENSVQELPPNKPSNPLI